VSTNEEVRSSLTVLDELALVRNYRTLAFDELDVQERGAYVEFTGHAAVYDEETQFDIPGMGTIHEVIDRGAFRRVLATKPEVPMLYNHDPHAILADTGNGTMTLVEDVRGLLVNARMDRSDPDVQRVVAKIASGLVRGMSFGFVAGRENQKIEHRNDGVLRRLSGFKKLLDVGPVVGPAYRGTDVAIRSALMKFADSSESLQQILMGAYPQLGEGEEPEGTEEVLVDELVDASASGVAGFRSVAARKRVLEVLLLETGGIDDAT